VNLPCHLFPHDQPHERVGLDDEPARYFFIAVLASASASAAAKSWFGVFYSAGVRLRERF